LDLFLNLALVLIESIHITGISRATIWGCVVISECLCTYSKIKRDLCPPNVDIRKEARFLMGVESVRKSRSPDRRGEVSQQAGENKERPHCGWL
jgi:hypothetical protein